jgi:hypothetical protein
MTTRSKHSLGAVEGWVVTHDGETLKSGFKSDFEAVAWLHKRQGQSVDWAVKHEGWDIVLVKNGKAVYSYRRAQNPSLGATELVELGAHGRQDEGTAYIDQVGGMWEARRYWYSKGEGRYFTVARKATRQEAVAAARKEGFKPVVISPGLDGKQDPWNPRYKAPKGAETIEGPEPIWPEFVDAYLEAALWSSSVGDDESPLDDQGYAIWDFAKKAIAEAIKDSNAFIRANRQDLESVGSAEQHGHDFWLTRNGHGAGFWDRGYGAIGKRLTEAAHAYGEASAYAGDDGKIYF